MTVSKNSIIRLHEIRCPACHRKLMIMREVNKQKPICEIISENNETKYLAETRCPSCKVFVGIKV
jgi:ssDNA-binding Zn-finger/Zn-ribbon topoisomerase 1